MRILQVCAVDFTAFHLLRPLLVGLREDGFDAEFACADGPWAARLRVEGFRHHAVPITRSVAPYRQLVAVTHLARSLRADPVELVHTHTPVGGFVGRAAALAWRGPVVHTFHGLPFRGGSLSPTERAFLVTERILARRTTYFFSQARDDGPRAVALGIARAKDLLVIGNGVDIRRFAPDAAARARVRQELGLHGPAVMVLVVARIVREKGLLDLADAALAARDANLHYVVVGDALPSDRTGVAAELDAHPVASALGPRWRRLGHRTDVDEILRAADIFVLPSHREGLPRSIIEAMASGLPVIATDIAACRELVREGETGLLVPVADAPRLAATITALAADPGRRAAMATQARTIAVLEHDERIVVERQIREIKRILSR